MSPTSLLPLNLYHPHQHPSMHGYEPPQANPDKQQPAERSTDAYVSLERRFWRRIRHWVFAAGRLPG